MSAMPDVAIINLSVDLLHEAERNPNRMDPREFKLLVEAIRTMGFLQPILVRPMETGGYRVIDGHHRLAAAKEVGMTQVPAVVVQKDADEETILRIAMNKLRGELDLTSVGQALTDLLANGWEATELKLTGFSDGEIADLLEAVSKTPDVPPTEIEANAPADYDPDAGDDDEELKVFELKVLFENRDDLKKAKRGLRRAGGKTKDMAKGLMKLLGEEQAKETS